MIIKVIKDNSFNQGRHLYKIKNISQTLWEATVIPSLRHPFVLIQVAGCKEVCMALGAAVKCAKSLLT